MQGYWKTSELEGDNAAYLESLYEAYQDDPHCVDEKWQRYFAALGPAPSALKHSKVQEAFIEMAKHPQVAGQPASDREDAYRKKGHLLAKTDPLNLQVSPAAADLGLDESLTDLKAIYTSSIGFEFMHIEEESRREWLQERVEVPRAALSPEQKKILLERLIAADGLEKYLGIKYVGQKRFSLEGGDALIPLMSGLIERASEKGVKEIAIGMAHRGRLNVLVNIMGKAPKTLFAEFEGQHDHSLLAGDVKYHNGFASDVLTAAGSVHLALAFNPSHLEIVSPVVEGSVHARLPRYGNDAKRVFAIQIHGDAAIAGQGCVYETLNMCGTKGFQNGGSVHIVINNQVGFTTSRPEEARSTRYCTDIAKMFDAPIFHVNGHDPEALLFVAQLAMDYRQQFQKEVFIDLVCYRRQGHNESDEPSGTQPLMYQVIKALPVPAKVYADRLIAAGVLNEDEWEALQQNYKKALDTGKPVTALVEQQKKQSEWAHYKKDWRTAYKAGIAKKDLIALAKKLDQLPETLHLQAQVEKALKDRAKMTAGELPVNWGYAEILAYATLVQQGIPVRLTGEDVGRGTFSHRHAILHDQKTDAYYVPLQQIAADQAPFEVYNSLLSEEAVLAFEYGYAASQPEGLTLWEAQFGDFVNGAQVIIDQFMSAAEEKWGRLCGLTLLLPHGQEGMGPEHSSARLERFLQLCAHDNMQVCNPTTPAQIYHLLRRQVLRPYRKPLVVMSPKSLLRHPAVISSLDDLAEGHFMPVIGETEALDLKKVKRVIFCQGKVYYDLWAKRRELQQMDVAIVRLEQMYPFPDQEVKAALKGLNHVKDWVWCQEEPENQGAWFKVSQDFAALDLPCRYVGRKAYASPAVGYASVFKEEQEALVSLALSH